METDHQGMLLVSGFQILGHQYVNTEIVLIDGFVAGAVNLEGGELLGVQSCS